MFGFLKKKLAESVDKLADKIKAKDEEKTVEELVIKQKPKVEKKPAAKPTKKTKPEIVHEEKPILKEKITEEQFEEEKKTEKKGSFLSRFRGKKESEEEKPKEEKKSGIKDKLTGKILERKVSEKDIDSLFEEMEFGWLEANVSLETVDFIKEKMKEYLVGQQLKRGNIENQIRETLERILTEIFDQGKVDLESRIKEKKPLCIVFLGYNGSGKTTSISKLGKYLTSKNFKIVLAAGDTFRAASIEQLEFHGEKLGLKTIKHKYGSDSAAVVFDAVEHAKAKGIDVVLADTAGRSHANQNLMDELKKVIRVNNPDIKILVMDSLTGNDLVEQAKNFDDLVGIDAMIFTKTDVNEKGGGMLSACQVVKKPILYIGTGQGYEDIELFDAKKFVKDLMGS
ncbi:MAG: signal recognition particle-docking protein FtsY [Candidatus Aenigmarchaeota archaeon]|nr:signal recognition particle-docking protein FtsY [Candidatus Aenigmarchaeota archaeon]